ncbi:MAG TPA: hypothetical protein VKA85_06010 [Candidatus Limnocylindrales bacterium]|nr:hypothetical protein [Candidatus Limnocylindrales bacterium]
MNSENEPTLGSMVHVPVVALSAGEVAIGSAEVVASAAAIAADDEPGSTEDEPRLTAAGVERANR